MSQHELHEVDIPELDSETTTQVGVGKLNRTGCESTDSRSRVICL
jgi:hypothetical protein